MRGFRRGVSGSRRYSEREANAIHSVVGATDRMVCPRRDQVSDTCEEARALGGGAAKVSQAEGKREREEVFTNFHSSKVLQAI